MEKVITEAIKLLRDSGVDAQLGFLYHEGTKIPIIVLVGVTLNIGDCIQTEKTVQ
jgi:hypothetical protein